MTSRSASAPLATVALARAPARLLAAPGFLALIGLLSLGAALVAVDPARLLLVAIGLLVVAVATWLAIRVLSLRLAVEPDYLHLRGIGTDRRYHLAPGSLSRVRSGGARRQRRRLPVGVGSVVGPAVLASGEQVEVIQLGAAPSMVLVPTEGGRVALAVASEQEFVAALMDAARTRAQRPAAPPPTVAAAPARAAGIPAPAGPAASVPGSLVNGPAVVASVSPAVPASVTSEAAVTSAAAIPAPAPPAQAPPPQPARPLTGIERMQMEERLARERRAALLGARSEQAAASFSASAAALTPAPRMPVPTVPMLPTPTPTVAAPTAPSAPSVPSSGTVRTIPRIVPRRRPIRPMARRIARPAVTSDVVLMLAPLALAAVVWVVAVATDAAPGTAGLDPLSVALLLCGPLTLLATSLAQRRWPRLAGMTSIAALLGLLLVGRALIA